MESSKLHNASRMLFLSKYMVEPRVFFLQIDTSGLNSSCFNPLLSRLCQKPYVELMVGRAFEGADFRTAMCRKGPFCQRGLAI